MNNHEFEQLLKEDFEIIKKTLCQKTVEYAGEGEGTVGDTDGDVIRRDCPGAGAEADEGEVDYLSCFKHAGEIAGVSPVEALRGFMLKHTASIYDMLRDPRAYTMDKWNEKIFDHINYLILLRALLLEGRTRGGSEACECERSEDCEGCEGREECEEDLRYPYGDDALKRYTDKLYELLREHEYNDK